MAKAALERRQDQRRRASDALKPRCPWCGASTSAVYRSKGDVTHDDKYCRRRQCKECGKDWPTQEGLDVAAFTRELAKKGQTLVDLGLAPARAIEGAAAPPAAQPRIVGWSEWFWSRS